jgi:hypothetical protein
MYRIVIIKPIYVTCVGFEVVSAVTMKNPSSEMRSRVTLLRTGISEERMASIIRMKIIGEVGITLAVISI